MDLASVNSYIKKVESSETKTGRPAGDRLKIGVDLGTAYIVVVVLDENDSPIACEKQSADVVRDGVVVDYAGALRIVRGCKEKLESRLERKLLNCAIAMPPGTESSVRTHMYVAEGAGFEVTKVLDEPTAANSVFGIEDGAIVDVGGGTTGLAVLRGGRVIKTADEPTGGTHLSLVLAGNYKVSLRDAESIKLDCRRHREILPIVRPVIEKMASISRRHIGDDAAVIYLCGGTCLLDGFEDVFAKSVGIRTIKPANPFLVTPAGIAINCNAG